MMDATQPNRSYRNAQQYELLTPSQAMFPSRNTCQHANTTQHGQNNNHSPPPRPNRVVHPGQKAATVAHEPAEHQQSLLQRAQDAWTQLFNINTDHDNIQVQDRNRPIQISLENQCENVGWGNELLEKQQDRTRLYVMNVNDLSLDHRGGQVDEVCKVAKEVQADFLCCQETNVDASQPLVRNILYHTTRQHWQRSRVAARSTPTTFSSMYKPGGTLVLSTGNVTGRFTASEADRWGRWTSQTF